MCSKGGVCTLINSILFLVLIIMQLVLAFDGMRRIEYIIKIPGHDFDEEVRLLLVVEGIYGTTLAICYLIYAYIVNSNAIKQFVEKRKTLVLIFVTLIFLCIMFVAMAQKAYGTILAHRVLCYNETFIQYRTRPPVSKSFLKSRHVTQKFFDIYDMKNMSEDTSSYKYRYLKENLFTDNKHVLSSSKTITATPTTILMTTTLTVVRKSVTKYSSVTYLTNLVITSGSRSSLRQYENADVSGDQPFEYEWMPDCGGAVRRMWFSTLASIGVFLTMSHNFILLGTVYGRVRHHEEFLSDTSDMADPEPIDREDEVTDADMDYE